MPIDWVRSGRTGLPFVCTERDFIAATCPWDKSPRLVLLCVTTFICFRTLYGVWYLVSLRKSVETFPESTLQYLLTIFTCFYWYYIFVWGTKLLSPLPSPFFCIVYFLEFIEPSLGCFKWTHYKLWTQVIGKIRKKYFDFNLISQNYI